MTADDRDVSQAVIARFQAKLASQALLPERSLRRNDGTYALVCYVNNVTALLVSENWHAVPIFIARAAEHMKAFPATARTEAYYSLITRYLGHVAHHLRHMWLALNSIRSGCPRRS
jgi:hypothetical protein